MDLEQMIANAKPMKKYDPNDDPEVFQQVKHCLGRGEKLMSFYSRTGLGRAQILTMTRNEIEYFVDVASQNAKDEVGPANFPPPTPMPTKLVI